MKRRLLSATAWLFLASFGFAEETPEANSVNFTSQVLPILSDACFQCHGPDEGSREAGLRLDLAEDALAVIEPGSPEESELLARVVSTDPDLVMPPPETDKKLNREQVAVLNRWIEQGANYETHWAFQPVRRPEIPSSGFRAWQRNPIDAFVARKLQSEGIQPSPPASRRTLIRRLSLDLTGLPPEPPFVDRWAERLRRGGEAAYQDLVGELLQSHHYGERWGRLWLDAARYADSDGYEKDKPRTAWFYRDWVIDSFNRDRPYDDFVIRQIAGDLLPDSRQGDHVATGFLRNSMVNEEGGADPEQFRMEAMFDRMDAIGKSILGITIQCAQCHTHKYDPLKQEEYYGLFAYLNSTHDAIIPVYSDEEQRQRAEVLASIEDTRDELKRQLPDWRSDMLAWAQQAAERTRPRWQTVELEFLDRTLGGSKFLPQGDGSYLCQGYAPTNFNPQGTGVYRGQRLTGLRLELLTHPNLPRGGPGRSVDGTWALSELTAEVTLSGPGDASDQNDQGGPIQFVRAFADRSPQTAALNARYGNKKKTKRTTGGIEFAIDGDATTAWTNEVDTPRANISQTAWFEFAEPIDIPAGRYAIVTVNLAQRHGGWNSDDNQTFNIGRFRISLTGDPIPPQDPVPVAVAAALQKPVAEWTTADERAVFDHWRTTVTEADVWNRRIAAAWRSHPRGTTQLTLAEREQPRTTSLLHRGDFLSPRQPVQPHTPAFLHAMQPSDEPPRLQLARWLASPQSPTTARSIVNRIWQAYFGIGIVETSDDLGTQSTPPSHPDVLDFLAAELMDHQWSLKYLHRLIVSSATYRQSSRVTPELQARDPYNRLLARGARFRVPAETVRDITLAASGLLCRELGGPSVYPPAPAFLFSPPASYGPKVWEVAEDRQRYRRAIYTFRFRSVPYPMLENFDAVPGNLSCVRRSRSNTPLQALTALNEPLFLEAAIALAVKTLRAVPAEANGQAVDEERIRYAFDRCLARQPTADEIHVLGEYLIRQRKRIASGQLVADEILVSGRLIDVGGLDAEQIAAWSLLCRVLLNLDETITRE